MAIYFVSERNQLGHNTSKSKMFKFKNYQTKNKFNYPQYIF